MVTRPGGFGRCLKMLSTVVVLSISIIDLSCHSECATTIVFEDSQSRSKFAFYSTF